MSTIPTALLEQSIALYASGLSTIKVASITGIGRGGLNAQLKKRGLIRSNKINSRKYTVQHDYFNKIDNERKAYWLGFLYADGYITRNRKQKFVGVTQHEKDLKHIEQFRTDLSATYSIGHYISTGYGVESPYCRLLMTSDQMFDDLQSKGVLLRKSLILTFPNENIVSASLIHHFIRGYFDGDGSFSKSSDGGFQVNILGTKEFLQRLAHYIGFPDAYMSQRHKNDKNNWGIEIGGRLHVITIGDYMYKDATIYLERKHKRYMTLINYQRKPVRNQYSK